MSHTAFPKLSHVLADNTLPTVFLEHPMNVHFGGSFLILGPL